jgi:DNA-binding response OmpR family regulator
MKKKLIIGDIPEHDTCAITNTSKILIVDDDDELRSNLKVVLEDVGYDINTAQSGEEALTMAEKDHFDVVILDLIMPDTRGMEVLEELRKIAPRTKVVMITAFASIDTAIEAIKKGASGYLPKPFKTNELIMTVKKSLEEARFTMSSEQVDLDEIFASLMHNIRRDTLKLLDLHKRMRLMEISSALEIEDHTKVVFHLKILKTSRLIHQQDKVYSLTKAGKDMIRALQILERHLPQ